MKNHRKAVCLLMALLLSLYSAVLALAAEIGEECKNQREPFYTGWRQQDGSWFYYDCGGWMLTGWQLVNGRWYFLNPLTGEAEGRMLTGWQWIDGKCYYLAENGTEGQPQGAMYAAGKTPDGYYVDASGAWMDAAGKVQMIPGKGIQTNKIVKTAKEIRFSGGGSGGGSGGSRKSSGSPGPSLNPFLEISSEAWENVSGEPEGEAESLKPIDYAPVKEATPSQARKVSWELKFVEAGSPENEIFKTQKGETEEDTELTIDFPETIVGRDGCFYHSLTGSPWRIKVNGTGTQKYYIEFEKGESLLTEEDPDQEAREKLKKWLELVRESDFNLTGEMPWDSQMITASQEESRERLLNMVSMADGRDRKEIYLIARSHTPSAAVVGQTFEEVINLSELVLDQFEIEGEPYIIMRVGFEKTYEEEACVHDYETVSRKAPSCMESGYETVRCCKCGKEETCLLPAAGHMDADHDGTCDICYRPAEEEPEAVHYQVGDVQARNIGGRIYLFRCIDDDYEDALENSQRAALFLCDRVIRSDADRTSADVKKLSFGPDNNYKHSYVRKWLKENAEDVRFNHSSYIGITHSYEGATESKAYDQLSEERITGYDREFQLMEDSVFCLSVDEALKYREALWRFEGSDENNPETQVSAYSKGYYLRSPQKGPGIYVVDLLEGSIRPAEVTGTDIGIRPAMTMPQA